MISVSDKTIIFKLLVDGINAQSSQLDYSQKDHKVIRYKVFSFANKFEGLCVSVIVKFNGQVFSSVEDYEDQRGGFDFEVRNNERKII